MVIQPQGRVLVLSGVDLTNKYKHTYSQCFKSADAQSQFFMRKKAYEFTEFTPVRLENAITVPMEADHLYHCDYIMFQNTNFRERWYYAFITKVEYVNVSVSKISYEIDIIQTWHRYLTIRPCFVERMHAYTDTIGSNIVPENLELGDYVVNGAVDKVAQLEKGWQIVVAASVDKSGRDAQGGIYGGIYSGLVYNVFDTPAQVNSFLASLTMQNKADAVVSIFMFPSSFVLSNNTTSPTVVSKTISKKTNNIDGYIPKNKKLFTHPYNFLMVTNNMGAAAEYKYELFPVSEPICRFKVSMDFSPNGTAMVWPQNYKNVAENINEKIAMDGIPLCPWTIDAYKAWLAQNGSATSIHNLGTAFSGLASLFSFNIPGAVSAGFSIAESMARQNAISALPPQAHGATGSNTLYANDMKNFYFYNMNIQQSFARRIDQYFSKFGYAQKSVMTPRMESRANWNYVETRDVTFDNLGAPAEAQAKLMSIYDSGITFWHKDNIGDYGTLDNPIVGV